MSATAETVENQLLVGQNPTGGGDADEPVVPEEQVKQVKAWLARIALAQRHDEARRKQYAIDRKYAKGDSSFKTVSVPIIPTFIDLLVAFIYARDPDLDIFPSESAGVSRQEEARLFGKTLQVVIKQLWKKSGLKRKAKRWVRSALTVGIGWLKVTWQEEFASDPVLSQRVRDLQENIAKIQAIQARIATGQYEDGETPEDCQLKLQQAITGATATTERVIYNGLGIAFIRAENIICSLDAESVVDCDTGSWMAERWYMDVETAIARFPHVPEERLRKLANYSPRKPAEAGESGNIDDVDAKDADYYKAGIEGGGSFICGYEVWDGEKNLILDVIEGLHQYAVPPDQPNVSTTRFYPFFPLAFCEVDNERHPQSLTERSTKLADEYDRSRNAFAIHRKRVRPKLVFDATTLTVASAKKINEATTAEAVGVKRVGGKQSGDTDLSKIVVPLQYNAVDMGLYDTTPIRQDLELVWGIQEALSGITVQKTATESEIQQSGTQARNGSKRDTIEDSLGELANHVAEMSLQKLSRDEVQVLAGPEAFWFDASNIDEVEQMVVIEIKAGSSGKSMTAQRQQAWGILLPQLQIAIDKVAALRQADPLAHADAIAALLQETMVIVGERQDAERYLPDPNPAWAAFMAQLKAQQAAAEAAGGQPGAEGGGGAPAPDPAVDQPAGAPPGAPDVVAPAALPETL